MTDGSSFRVILRASSISGLASVVNAAANLAKFKAAAVLLGPAGVGLIGVYQNLVQTAATVSALGMEAAGTRRVAQAQAEGSAAQMLRIRSALIVGSLGLAVIGTMAFWLGSPWIAELILGDRTQGKVISWLCVGVGMTVAATAPLTLLTGMRRIADVAKVQAVTGVVAAAGGIVSLRLWGTDGMLALILLAPLVSLIVGYCYLWRVERLAPDTSYRSRWSDLPQEWRAMAWLGIAFMISGVVTTAGHLAVRALVQRDLNAEALGYFQASWAIGNTYLGFVLAAMGTDFFPRLTNAVADPTQARKLVNEQTEVALLLCAPALLAVMGFAPFLIRVLYSAEFEPAADILRWQIFGDVLKVISWPLGFLLLASGAGRTFIATETAATAVFVGLTAVALPIAGVTATGIAFLGLYAVYLPLVLVLARRRFGFRLSSPVVILAILLILGLLGIEFALQLSELAGACVGFVLAAVFGLRALVRLSSRSHAGASQSARFGAWLGRVSSRP